MKKKFLIKDLFEVASGSTPSTSIDRYWRMNGDGIKWITPKDLSKLKDAYINVTERKISLEGLNNCSARLIPKGSIILSSRAPIGYVAVLKDDMACNQGCKALIPKEQNSVDSLYIYYLLSTKAEVLNNLGSGSTFKELSKTKLEEFEIEVDDIATQKQIGQILENADRARQQRKAANALTEQFLQSSFLHLFGDPVTNDKGWNVESLVECVTMKGGGTPDTSKDEYYDGNIPWVSPKDMKSRLISTSIDKITEKAIKESSTKLIEPNNVLLVVRSGILKKTLPIGINICPVAINQDMKALKCKDSINPFFLAFQLEAMTSKILQNVRGTTADNISSEVLKAIQIIIPPLTLQQHFASLVADTEVLRQKQQQSERELEHLYQSLLQKYFGERDVITWQAGVEALSQAAEPEMQYAAQEID